MISPEKSEWTPFTQCLGEIWTHLQLAVNRTFSPCNIFLFSTKLKSICVCVCEFRILFPVCIVLNSSGIHW